MTCCAPGAEAALEFCLPLQASPSDEEIVLASRTLGKGFMQTDLAVPGIHCAACIHAIEKALLKLPEVRRARVNLSTRRVSVTWREGRVPPLIQTLNRLGYEAHLFEAVAGRKDEALGRLIRAVAVAGFAAGNIMLLSVSVWAGADGATRDLFHWISALLAVPALAYSGAIFYRSAWRALRHGRTNMDVPISIGLALAFGLSLYETATHGAEAYFDASVSLLFFLLVGRTLDHAMREKARSAVSNLRNLSPRGATVIATDGSREFRPLSEVTPGTRVTVSAGERIPVDGSVVEGSSEVDCALVTGESTPRPSTVGDGVQAGTLNLTGPLVIVATASPDGSFLAETARLMERAEEGRPRYRLIADRAAALYAPLVHSAAFLTFVGWLWIAGDWHYALQTAIAVLIITCPCALGLAVPMVQVMAARRLFEKGILMKDGSALERLAEIDTVVLDKTGTATTGELHLLDAEHVDPALLATASLPAAYSSHPYSRAIVRAASRTAAGLPGLASIKEVPGCGMEGTAEDGAVYRLGRPSWALPDEGHELSGPHLVLARDGRMLAGFRFDDAPRPDAREAVERLKAVGLAVELLSGDHPEPVRRIADTIGAARWRAGQLPADKVRRLSSLANAGRKALMVGDGLNDAPALAAAHVSMAPATAADIGRNAADFVFMRESLLAVPRAFETAVRARTLVRENLAFAASYNVVAVPLAVMGHVTPLLAAIAMSLSSLAVVANALRLGHVRQKPISAVARRAQRSGFAKDLGQA